ncbi:MAG: hypothetical protein KIT61_01620 [Pyrinomonadaceae bacterium]|nr:hypothetical protein [Pyrinomonadaceae bacterium]
MTKKHYYRCFGCEKKYQARSEATVCCAVVQEIFECEVCGEMFANRPAAERHIETISHEITNFVDSFKTANLNAASNQTI